jgi:type I restriction enzyme S subunit
MAFSKYTEYQSLESAWLPAIPSTWGKTVGKAVFKEKKTKNIGMRQEQVLSLSYGQIIKKLAEKLHGLVPASFEGYQIICPGDIIMRSIDLQNDKTSLRFGISHHHGIITPAYLCLQVGKLLVPEYAYLLLHSYDVMKVFYGLGSGLRQNISFADFKYLPLPIPPRPEQDQIVAYLRAQDAHIARFIKAKRDLIKLLTEQKLRIIDHAVTRGLDASVRLKPSGIEWLGEVPAHWEVLRLRRLARESIKNGVGESAQHFREDWPRYIRITDIAGPTTLKDSTKASLPLEIANRAPLSPGDLLFAAVGATFGKSYLHTEMGHPCCYAGFLVKVSPNELATSEFLSLWAQSNVYWDQLRSQVIQATIQNFSASRYKDLVVSVPPVEEQQAICRWITDECQPLDDAIARTEEEIKLIREYRDRLITDVVTGQIDVRHWQPSPDDVASAEELAALDDDEATMDEEALTDDAD